MAKRELRAAGDGLVRVTNRAPSPGQPALTLAYHAIGEISRDRDPFSLFVRRRDFMQHMRLLQRWGYQLTTFGELAGHVRDGTADGHAAITFDDGMVDCYTTLMPLLESLRVPATVFVVSGWLGRSHPDPPQVHILEPSQIRQLADAGFEIGAHGHSHTDLTTLPYAEAKTELEISKAVLEDLVQQAVTVAAYPFGRATSQTWRAAEEAGFRAACRTGGAGSWSNPFDLPRQDMNTDSSTVGLWLKRNERYEPVMRHRSARVLRRGARSARRAMRLRR